MYEQAVKVFDPERAGALVDTRKHLGQHLAPLLDGKQGLLLRIDEDGDDDFVEQLAAALYDVQMTVRHGVE
jgi:hypothetical protein